MTATIPTLTPDEVETLISDTLERIGLTTDEVAAQAAAGRFESDAVARAWLVLDALGAFER
jgi:hypothetical protein